VLVIVAIEGKKIFQKKKSIETTNQNQQHQFQIIKEILERLQMPFVKLKFWFLDIIV